MKYTVIVKQVYRYDGVPAKNKKDAVSQILDADWLGHDYSDQNLEATAEKEEI